MTDKEVPRLEVYMDRSVLVESDGDEIVFLEGAPTKHAKDRLEKIRTSLAGGFLADTISYSVNPANSLPPVRPEHQEILDGLVSSVTSEVGRAIIGLTVLQLCIKAISPQQSIRLHKAGAGGANFSWREGIPMRVLDKSFITPVLRSSGLLNLNADGFMMTRSLAENYPYSHLYKAAIRGARREWLEIVECVENNELDALAALQNLIRLLSNRSDRFKKDAASCIAAVKTASMKLGTVADLTRFIVEFIDSAPYSARLFEVAMHSLFQVLDEDMVFEGFLKPLSQMRSANKKHGNIGDIEIVSRLGGLEILESWDAKFGKSELRDELEELNEKLMDHTETLHVDFVSDCAPRIAADLAACVQELEGLHSVSIELLSFSDWVPRQLARSSKDPVDLCRRWVVAFAECLCQLRRDRAPIDEPCDAWVVALGRTATAV